VLPIQLDPLAYSGLTNQIPELYQTIVPPHYLSNDNNTESKAVTIRIRLQAEKINPKKIDLLLKV
jgi:hypothetical protein